MTRSDFLRNAVGVAIIVQLERITQFEIYPKISYKTLIIKFSSKMGKTQKADDNPKGKEIKCGFIDDTIKINGSDLAVALRRTKMAHKNIK